LITATSEGHQASKVDRNRDFLKTLKYLYPIPFFCTPSFFTPFLPYFPVLSNHFSEGVQKKGRGCTKKVGGVLKGHGVQGLRPFSKNYDPMLDYGLEFHFYW
jgi:hypothetical protein